MSRLSSLVRALVARAHQIRKQAGAGDAGLLAQRESLKMAMTWTKAAA